MSKYSQNERPILPLVTGATGNIGARVVNGLLARGSRPRVLVRDAGKARALFGDCVDYALGDLSDPRLLAAACAGVDALFLVNSGADLARRDGLAAAAAKAAGVGHLVKLSSLGARATGRAATAVALWHAAGRGRHSRQRRAAHLHPVGRFHEQRPRLAGRDQGRGRGSRVHG